MSNRVFPGFNLILILVLASRNLSYSQNHSHPDGRSSALFIYYPPTKSTLLIDGYTEYPDSTVNDVWSWNGKVWRKIPGSGPGPRSLSAGAFDKRRERIVVYGGIDKGGYETGKRDDAWLFNGKAWSKLEVNKVGTRDHHEMVYDESLNAFIMYGGLNNKREYDSTTWILRNNQFTPCPCSGPGARYHFAMAYDRRRKRVVLYGGGKPELRNEIWEFDGKNWQHVQPSDTAGPGPRIWNSLVYSDDLKMVVVHGGLAPKNEDTWGWNGKDWTKIATGGPIGKLIALGYDPKRKTILAYGGSDSEGLVTSALWELYAGKWKKISDNGKWKWDGQKYTRTN